MDATKLIVDGANGMYCWKALAERYPLYQADGSPVPNESIVALTGDDWCEELDCLGDVYVKDLDTSELWLVYQDCDIWAVNPRAVWSDDQEWYCLPED